MKEKIAGIFRPTNIRTCFMRNLHFSSRSNRHARLLACGCLFALSACASGSQSIRTDEALADTASFSSGKDIGAAAVQPGRTVAVSWWTAWRDPQLDRLIASEASTAPSIAVAAARMRRAAAGLDAAIADRLPTVDGSAQAVGERFPDHSTYDAPYAGNWGSDGALTANASYALDFWGKRRDTQAAAAARLDMARAEADDATLLLRTALVDAYVRLDAAYHERDMATAGLARRQGVIDLLSIRERAGLATGIETTQTREATTATRDEIARLDGEIAARRHQIAALLGRDPAFADGLTRPSLKAIVDPAPLSAIPANLLGARADVAAARAAVEAAARDIGVARAAFYPDVDLIAFSGVKSVGLGSLLRAGSIATGAGAAVSLPIFDGGRLRANLRGKAADYDAAVAAYNGALTEALRQVADGVSNLTTERARQGEARAAIAHWSRILDLQKLRERQGLSSAADRLSTETALLLAQRHAAKADARVAVAQIALIRALGGAWTPSSTLSGQVQ
ncbi:efflux transporter outer membrane subunit [Brevundimonas sp. SL130]|uniref:efflux transporter outer membrane subunit n=1 Tax=Brevundimonas sp. SL130 TaxID=2995143 RepID=UPI00226CB344|nr:efflux transporter outer membrane subunit [Brevundimonas sp. SL130]WAC61295.1 efflux transporter outer membrane subunit [Brevundimonas sp. SL130]